MSQVSSVSSRDQLRPLLLRLWGHIGPHRRMQFMLVAGLTTLASFAEVVTIGTVIPFLMALTSPQTLYKHAAAQPLIAFLGISSKEDLVLVLTCCFAAASVGAGLLRVALLWANAHFSSRTGADLSISIYRRTLYQPYAVHVSRNTADVIGGVTIKTSGLVSNVFSPALTLMSTMIMMLSILGALVFIDPMIALGALGGFALIYGVIMKFTRRRLANNSERTTRELNRAIKVLQEGLGGIRDVLIDGTQKIYCETYRLADLRMRNAHANTLFLSQYPRFLIEALGTVLIAIVAYVLAGREAGVGEALPVLGALALGAQRMLPVVQQGYASWASIIGSRGYLADTIALLDQPLPEYLDTKPIEPLRFKKEICLKQIAFRYTPDTPWVLNNVDLTIAKGRCVGFIGESGSGKSTLLDIVMGLLTPTSGALEVDGQVISVANQRSWQVLVSHVPQAIFLTDSSVAENIAFGVPTEEIDMDRVRRAARRAQISDLIESWPGGYGATVGERGVKLSGGQRQRIGIARALYKQAEVIIFDEATSALDNQTEEAVMRAIEGLGKDLTILIIAHRLSTLSICDEIVEISNQRILRIGTYAEVVTQRQAANAVSERA